MPHINTVDSYVSRAVEYLFHSDEPSWKRVMSIAIPLLVLGIGIAAVRRYYSYTPISDRPSTGALISLSELQKKLKEDIPPFKTIFPDEVATRHEAAKKDFSDALKEFNIGSEVRYVKAVRTTDCNPSKRHYLIPTLFCWSKTQGVEKDILAASHQAGEIHLFSVASQYNATEAGSRFTPLPGKAMLTSEDDPTQGPASQRTNPRLFELVNGYLANMGFNMLAEVLDEQSLGALSHGYLSPDVDNIEKAVAENFEKNWQKVEQPCFSSHPDEGGPHAVYLMLGAAPAYGRYCSCIVTHKTKKIQFYAALANFTAQFNQVLHLAKTNPGKKIVYHAAGIGLGVFENDPVQVGKAFNIAAAHFESQCKEWEDFKPALVQIQFDVFLKDGAPDPIALACAREAGLTEKPLPPS